MIDEANKPLIHIVDDNAFVRESMSALITSVGYEARAFADPQRYIDHLNSDSFMSPVALFVDVIMPSMNGYELIRAIQPIKPEIKFIIMSGEFDVHSDHKHLACMYLKKPFHIRRIKETLNNINQCNNCSSLDYPGCHLTDDRMYFSIPGWSCQREQCS